MADSQRAKAAALVDPDVLTLGKMSQRTTKTTNPVEQANMSRQGAASPQPRLTPTSRPFKKGGSTAGKMKKAAAVAGMLSALAQGSQGAPPSGGPMGAAPPAAPAMAGPAMGAPPGMKRGGRRMAMGGATDDEGNRMNGMKRGGVTKVPMRGAANKKPDSGTGGNLVPRSKGGRMGYAKGGSTHGDEAEDKKLFKRMFKSEEAKEGPEKMKRGGKCLKCGGMAHGGACMKKGGRSHFAMGGVGKMRKGVADKAGKPIAQKKHNYEDSLI